MKRTNRIIALLFFAASIMFGNASFAQTACCPKAGKADCPLIQNCPKKGTKDCPYVVSAATTQVSNQLANCPQAGTPDCPLIANCPKKGSPDCPYAKGNNVTASVTAKGNFTADASLPPCCRKQ